MISANEKRPLRSLRNRHIFPRSAKLEKIRRAVTLSAGYTNKLVKISQLRVNFIPRAVTDIGK
jgi:hypothetical protein